MNKKIWISVYFILRFHNFCFLSHTHIFVDVVGIVLCAFTSSLAYIFLLVSLYTSRLALWCIMQWEIWILETITWRHLKAFNCLFFFWTFILKPLIWIHIWEGNSHLSVNLSIMIKSIILLTIFCFYLLCL